MKQKSSIAVLVASILLMMLPTGIFASDTAAADLVINTAEDEENASAEEENGVGD